MSYPNRQDFAESPLASELPDLDALDSDLDRAAEFIAEAIASAPTVEGIPRTLFAYNACKILAAPFAEALSAAAANDGGLAQIEFVAALLGEVNAAKNPHMAMRCLPIIFDLQIGGESEQDIADDFGVGRAAISALCIELRRRLRVPPGRGMRSLETCEKYAARQRGRRAKPLPTPWPHRGMMARIKSSLVA